MGLQRGQRSHTISKLVHQHMEVIRRIGVSYNNALPPSIPFKNDVSFHYGARRIGWEQGSAVMDVRYNDKQQDQLNENEMETAWKRQKFSTNGQDCFKRYLHITHVSGTCRYYFDFKGIPTNRTNQYIVVWAPNNLTS